jgi:hypothetical protein
VSSSSFGLVCSGLGSLTDQRSTLINLSISIFAVSKCSNR